MEVLLFLARRLAIAAVLLVALTFITFVIFFKVPSEPAAFLVDPKTATQAQIKAARHVLGADRPVHVQFAKYVWRLAHADFGRSWRTYYVSQLRKQVATTHADGAFLDSTSVPNGFGADTFTPKLPTYDPPWELGWTKRIERNTNTSRAWSARRRLREASRTRRLSRNDRPE